MYIERIRKIYIGYFLLYVAVLVSIASVYLWLEYQQDIELHKAREETQLELVKISVERDLNKILPDVNLLAQNAAIIGFLKQGDNALHQQLLTQLETFVVQKRSYSMVAVFDKTGQEKLHLDYIRGKIHSSTENRTQDNINRHYINEATALKAGELYVSQMDLNMENGVIEQPYNPVLHFAAPIVDSEGRHWGIIILKYMAEHLLNNFDQMLIGSGGHMALLNAQGYWLRSQQKEREWGFRIGADWVYSNSHPDEWQKIQASAKGQFINEQGLFTFTSIYPSRLLNQYTRNIHQNSVATGLHNANLFHWKIVSNISMQSIHDEIKERVFGKLVFTCSLALLLGMLTIALLARLRSQREDFQGQLELHAMLYANTTEGVMITDANGKIIEVNDAFQEITSYSQDDVIGHNPNILSSGRQDKAFYKRMWSALKEHGAWEGEITNRRKDGTLIVEWLRIYVIKDENDKIINNIAVFSDITGKKLTEEEMHRRAHQDTLTGLANRLSFDERLQQDLARARRSDNKLALLFIDLDKFKPINDNYGHQAGDEVLLEVARRLLKELREMDTVARVGGDEFIVILAELTCLKDIESVSERILHSLREAIYYNDNELHISASIGIALFPDDGLTERELIANADKAMYDVKRNYRNGYGYFSQAKEFGNDKDWCQLKQKAN